MTEDGAFRVIVASTAHLLREAFALQSASGDTARHFGDLLTGTVLVRETMSPTYRVQGILRGSTGTGSLVVDTHPDGGTRGLVQRPQDARDGGWFGEGSVLQVMRSLASGRMFRSVVKPPEDGDVSAALMTYLQESEQVVAVIATGMTLQDGRVATAGGYVVQLLPGAPRGALMIMTERLERFPPVETLLAPPSGSVDGLLREILRGMPFAQLEERPVTHRCRCGVEAVVSSLATLGRAELEDLLRERDLIEMTCDYCNTNYRIGRAQLAGLLQPS